MVQLPTLTKIAVARMLSTAVTTGRRLVGQTTQARFRRNGIEWELDLEEGIDFAIFLFGQFDLSTARAYRRLVNPGDTVLDIGANIGAHTLPLAHRVGPRGRVVAFEPTEFAFRKLMRNLELNQELAHRVSPVHALLVRDEAATPPSRIHSSWPLVRSDALHPGHGGALKSTGDCKAVRLDDWIADNELQRVDFIKLDVDGSELHVLGGGRRTLENDRPLILLELCPHLFDDNPSGTFADLIELLAETGYALRTLAGRALPMADSDALQAMIPRQGSINAIGSRA
ncbi:MAG: FkbM family methyltransferase [Myxococcota bacterium]